VLLAHGAIQLLALVAIEFAGLAVLVPGRFTLLVLLPEQHEGEMLVATLFRHHTGRVVPEWWPESNRNAGRLTAATVAAFPSESWPDSPGIRNCQPSS